MKFSRAFFFLIIAELTVIILALFNYGFTIQGLQAVARFSGRLSLLIFSFIFLFHRNEKIKTSAFLPEKYFLLFALAHGIHFAELAVYVHLSQLSIVPMRLVGGFLAYILIFIMPWLTSAAKTKKISASIYNKTGIFYISFVWFIFFMTYLGRVQGNVPQAGGTYQEHVVLLGWICMLLGIKILQIVTATTIFRVR